MKTSRKNLLEVLTSVLPGLAAKEEVEQSTSFVFKDGRVYTFNDEVAVSCPTDLDIEGAVQGKELYALLNKLTAEEVDVTVKENQLRVKAGRSNSGITLEEEVTMPLDEIPQPQEEDWKKIPVGLLEGIAFTLFSCSREASMPVLTNVHVAKGVVESCDGYRATRYEGKKIKKSFLIPASSAQQLIKYKDISKYAVMDGWAVFGTKEGLIFSCRVFEEKYPELDSFFDFEGFEIKFPEKIADVLDKASIFMDTSDDLGERVTISLQKKKMIVRGEGQKGWFEEEVPTKYKGDEVQFVVNPAFLKQAIATLDHVLVGESRLKFVGENFSHIVALLAEDD
jgi:DNA polymerase III sliding clamp (beta) subunit (PCNA family)